MNIYDDSIEQSTTAASPSSAVPITDIHYTRLNQALTDIETCFRKDASKVAPLLTGTSEILGRIPRDWVSIELLSSAQTTLTELSKALTDFGKARNNSTIQSFQTAAQKFRKVLNNLLNAYEVKATLAQERAAMAYQRSKTQISPVLIQQVHTLISDTARHAPLPTSTTFEEAPEHPLYKMVAQFMTEIVAFGSRITQPIDKDLPTILETVKNLLTLAVEIHKTLVEWQLNTQYLKPIYAKLRLDHAALFLKTALDAAILQLTTQQREAQTFASIIEDSQKAYQVLSDDIIADDGSDLLYAATCSVSPKTNDKQLTRLYFAHMLEQTTKVELSRDQRVLHLALALLFQTESYRTRQIIDKILPPLNQKKVDGYFIDDTYEPYSEEEAAKVQEDASYFELYISQLAKHFLEYLTQPGGLPPSLINRLSTLTVTALTYTKLKTERLSSAAPENDVTINKATYLLLGVLNASALKSPDVRLMLARLNPEITEFIGRVGNSVELQESVAFLAMSDRAMRQQESLAVSPHQVSPTLASSSSGPSADAPIKPTSSMPIPPPPPALVIPPPPPAPPGATSTTRISFHLGLNLEEMLKAKAANLAQTTPGQSLKPTNLGLQAAEAAKARAGKSGQASTVPALPATLVRAIQTPQDTAELSPVLTEFLNGHQRELASNEGAYTYLNEISQLRVERQKQSPTDKSLDVTLQRNINQREQLFTKTIKQQIATIKLSAASDLDQAILELLQTYAGMPSTFMALIELLPTLTNITTIIEVDKLLRSSNQAIAARTEIAVHTSAPCSSSSSPDPSTADESGPQTLPVGHTLLGLAVTSGNIDVVKFLATTLGNTPSFALLNAVVADGQWPEILELTEAIQRDSSQAEAGKIYINETGQYTVRTPAGNIETGELLPEGNLDLSNLASRLSSRVLQHQILTEMAKRKLIFGDTPLHLAASLADDGIYCYLNKVLPINLKSIRNQHGETAAQVRARLFPSEFATSSTSVDAPSGSSSNPFLLMQRTGSNRSIRHEIPASVLEAIGNLKLDAESTDQVTIIIDWVKTIKGALPVEPSTGNTVLHLAVANNASALVEALLALDSAKALVNTTNKVGDTPLHIAASAGSETLYRQLVAAGANVIIAGAEGVSAQMLLKQASVSPAASSVPVERQPLLSTSRPMPPPKPNTLRPKTLTAEPTDKTPSLSTDTPQVAGISLLSAPRISDTILSSESPDVDQTNTSVVSLT